MSFNLTLTDAPVVVHPPKNVKINPQTTDMPTSNSKQDHFTSKKCLKMAASYI